MSELRISNINAVEGIGTVSEFNLTVKQNKKNCTFEDGTEKEITSACIYGKIALDVNGDTREFSVVTNKHTKSGNETRNFKGLCHLAGIDYEIRNDEVVYFRATDEKLSEEDKKLLNKKTLKPMIKGTSTIMKLGQTKDSKDLDTVEIKGVGKEKASRVKIKGSLSLNKNLNQDRTDLKIKNQISVNGISSTTETEDKCSFSIEGYVSSIFDEIGNNGSGTGAKFIDIVHVGYFGVEVFTLKIPKQWEFEADNGEMIKLTAQDYENNCPVGSTITAYGDVDAESVGVVAVSTSTKKSFGAKSNVTSGFKRIEFMTKGADIEESTSENAYKKEDMDVALKEYDITLDAEYDKLLKDAKEKDEKKQQTNNKTSQRGIGRRNSLSSVSNSGADSPF